MDIKQLEIFSCLAQELHFARTASACHLTPSAITRTVQRLEDELGCQLLTRNSRQVELTKAGQLFADYARETIAHWQELKIRLQAEQNQLQGSLKIYSSVTASYGLLSQMLRSFRQEYPSVEIHLHTGDQALAIDHVLSGDEEMAIAALPASLPESIGFKTLMFSPLRFIMPAEVGVVSEKVNSLRANSAGVINPAELPLIVSEVGLARDRLDEWLQTQRVAPNIYAQVSGHEAIVSMVALGFGVGVVPEIVINHSPMRDNIRVIEDAPELQAFQIGLCVLKSRLNNPAVKAFWEAADPALFE